MTDPQTAHVSGEVGEITGRHEITAGIRADHQTGSYAAASGNCAAPIRSVHSGMETSQIGRNPDSVPFPLADFQRGLCQPEFPGGIYMTDRQFSLHNEETDR